MPYPNHLRVAERTVIDRILKKALDEKGYLISVYDGEEWVLCFSQNLDAIAQNIGQTEQTALRFRHRHNGIDVGTIILIHGNDEDVVHDYSDRPEIRELVDV